MVPDRPQSMQRVTFLLMAIATGAVEITAGDSRSLSENLGLAAIWVALAISFEWMVPRPRNPQDQPPQWVFFLLVGLATLPFVWEPLRRSLTGNGYPPELQMVLGLRNIGLGLVACGGWRVCMRMACVVSLYLMLFVVTMNEHLAIRVALGLYAVAGSFWLMLVYWLGLKSVFVASQTTVVVEVGQGRERLPWGAICLLLLAAGGGLALILAGPKRAAFALAELMPTSGGTSQADPFARSGIGDGPKQSTGDEATSAGLVDTDRMIEDGKDSLFDAVSEMYGPPQKTTDEYERKVAIGKANMIEFHGKLAENRRASRSFDTNRKGPKETRPPGSQSARGLFEVEGRTPLHIRLVVYDRYDAMNDRWVESGPPTGNLIHPEGDDWMRLGHLRPPGEGYQEDEHHSLKVADMKDPLVPTPTLLASFRIKMVNRPDIYRWDYDGVIALCGRKRTPSGVIVNTVSRTLDPAQIPGAAFVRASLPNGVALEHAEVPIAIHKVVAPLAREWGGDRLRGWPQIEAVITKLRTEYHCDRTATAPPGPLSPVAWFLTESRRGPDYHFATAAALLLRTLDYPTRVCLGYYASPAAYDSLTAHTPVKRTDLHFWAEVQLRDGHWMVIETTPGYEVLAPQLPLGRRLLCSLVAIGEWGWGHVVEMAGAIAAMTLVWGRRREIFDAAAACLWRTCPGRTWREQVRRTVRLLERRGRWVGRDRTSGQTATAWLRSVYAQEVHHDFDLGELVRMAEWSAYAPDRWDRPDEPGESGGPGKRDESGEPSKMPPWSQSEVLAVCRRVVNKWNLRHWRELVISEPGLGA